MRWLRVLPVLAMPLVFAACAGSTVDWGATCEQDTESAYQQFLSKHPDSEFSQDARERVQQFQYMAAREAEAAERRAAQHRVQMELERVRIEKLGGYEPGQATLEQFLADGWGPAPIDGLAGVVELIADGDRVEYKLGTMAVSSDAASGLMGLAAVARETGMREVHMTISYDHLLCTVVFERGILESIVWNRR